MKTKLQKRCLGIGLTLIVSAALLLSSGCAHDPWSKSDKTAAGVMILGRGADMYSTHDAVSRGAEEQNPFSGEKPDDGSLALWWAGSSALCIAIAHFLPSEYQEIFLYTIAGISGAFAIKNYNETR